MYDSDMDDFVKNMLDLQKAVFEQEFEDIDIDDAIDVAETGDEDCQFMVGLCYLLGIQVHRNYNKAVKWLEMGARQGNMGAEYFLGYCYACGLGVEEDVDEAIRWVRRSVKHGYTEGKLFLKMLEELYDT